MTGESRSNGSMINYINCNLDWLQSIPKNCLFSTEFLVEDKQVSGRPESLENRGIIKEAGVVEPDTPLFEGRNSRKTVWHLSENAVNAIQEREEHRLYPLPCDHVGFTNLPDSPFYQCNECNARFTKEEIKEYNG